MKKGISLIVLVITIIVMIIIAGAIILALNSSNVTNKANWAQISADRSNLQSEFATILADVVARQKIGAGQDYIGLKISDLKNDNLNLYNTWVNKVNTTNTRFEVLEPSNTNPGGIKVVMKVTPEEAVGFGLADEEPAVGTKPAGYDWVVVSDSADTTTVTTSTF